MAWDANDVQSPSTRIATMDTIDVGGATSDVSFDSDISGGNARLKVVLTSDNWSMRAQRMVI